MKKIALISLAIMASLFPLCSMAQQGVDDSAVSVPRVAL